MGHNMASWKVLEDLMIELSKKGVAIPPNVINDLRSAKGMIGLACKEESRGEVIAKAEEYTANVEAYLISEAQKVLGTEKTDQWLERLEEAGAGPEVCAEPQAKEDKFVTGVPRDQKWVRVEPMGNLPKERILAIAKETSLQVNPQKDGRLVVYGQQPNIKEFLKKMVQAAKK
jgi:hypothetical protein